MINGPNAKKQPQETKKNMLYNIFLQHHNHLIISLKCKN